MNDITANKDDSPEEYDYVKEMDKLISGYEELCLLMSEYQNNESEKGFLPVNLLEKMNEQLRDHYSTLASDLRMYKLATDQYFQQNKEGKAQLEAV